MYWFVLLGTSIVRRRAPSPADAEPEAGADDAPPQADMESASAAARNSAVSFFRCFMSFLLFDDILSYFDPRRRGEICLEESQPFNEPTMMPFTKCFWKKG